MSPTDLDQLIDQRYAEALAKCYRTDPANRPRAEELARQVFGPDVKKYVWAEGLDSAVDFAVERGGVEYWMQSECDRPWVTFYASADLLSDVVWSDEDRKLIQFAVLEEELLDSCFACIITEDATCILVERPYAYHVDELGRPHRIGGPDLAFRDGKGTFHWHGVRMPKSAMTQPESITLQDIEEQRNAEVRRALISLYGEGRWLMDTQAVPLDSDRQFGDLYRLNNNELILLCSDGVPQLDGSTPRYTLRVNRECRPMRETAQGIQYGEPQPLTARNAAAASYGLRGDEYAPSIRT